MPPTGELVSAQGLHAVLCLGVVLGALGLVLWALCATARSADEQAERMYYESRKLQE